MQSDTTAVSIAAVFFLIAEAIITTTKNITLTVKKIYTLWYVHL